MEQNIFTASFIFFVPLHGIKWKYRRLHVSTTHVASFSALFPNARCCYKHLSDYAGKHSLFTARSFTFKSRYNGRDETQREVEVKPFLVEFESGGRLRVLALSISVDKVFDRSKQKYESSDLCTEFDLVSLKKAFFENCLHSVTDSNTMGKWLADLLYELDGVRRTHIAIPYSIVDINVESIDIPNDGITAEKLEKDFKAAFYKDKPYPSIDDFLAQGIDVPLNVVQSTRNGCIVNECCFVYGLLYANDNFMMLHKDTQETVIKDFYTNNRVEKFWADDGSIVRVITHCPYFLPSYQCEQKLKGNPSDVCYLYDMGMLIFLKHKFAKLKRECRRWSSDRIEKELGKATECLFQRLHYHTDLDRRMDYFKRKFCLYEAAEDVRHVATPRKNIIEMIFNRNTTLLAIIIALLTLLFTIRP